MVKRGEVTHFFVKRGEVYRAKLDDAERHEKKGDKATGWRPVGSSFQ